MTVIATMPFIRYHKAVADYLMGLTDEPPRADKRWPHAAAFVEPQMDQRRGYITMSERAKQEAELFNKLYATKATRKKACGVATASVKRNGVKP